VTSQCTDGRPWDTFDRADETPLATSSSGDAWTMQPRSGDFDPPTTDGVASDIRVISNQARVATVNHGHIATMDFGTPDVDRSIVLPAGSSHPDLSGRAIVARHQAAALRFYSAMLYHQQSPHGWFVFVSRYNGSGVPAVTLDAVADPLGGAFSTDRRLRFVVTGSNPVRLRLFLDGTKMIDVSDASAGRYDTGDLHGIFHYAGQSGSGALPIDLFGCFHAGWSVGKVRIG
jgi:hypothetical protein